MKYILLVCVIILSVIVCFIYSYIVYSNIEDRLIFLEIKAEESDSLYKNEPTVFERMQEQEVMREKHYTDSIYITIPELVLIYIFVQKGTSIPIKDVVQEYVMNKKWYDENIKNRDK